MMLSSRFVHVSSAACVLVCLALAYDRVHLADSDAQISGGESPTTFNTSVKGIAQANELIRRQPCFFVPNLGQWDHPGRFVHRSGSMTLFLEDRGWVIDLVERPDQKVRGVALRMTFAGDGHVPYLVGEKKSGHHNYFLGDDETRWRAAVPIYASVRYGNLYPGIDLRLREMKGVPEYDLLLQPGADLSMVNVHVEGGQGLSIAKDGSLVIATTFGQVTQTVPKTWQVGADGRTCDVVCNFTLLGPDRFGFEVIGWEGDTSLTIDPGLVWSTFLGGRNLDRARGVAVDARGLVTVVGNTISPNFPTTIGAYDTTHNGPTVQNFYLGDAFVSRLDPSKIGTAQVIDSTFLGGSSDDHPFAVSVDASGVVTVVGNTHSSNFPTTRGAYDTTFGGSSDAFISRLDLSKTGRAQLVYSTFLGGDRVVVPSETASSVSVDANGAVTVAGQTGCPDFPTTSGAFDRIHNGSAYRDVFVSRLDPSKIGSAQLVYSTFLGGNNDFAHALAVDASGVVTVAGSTVSPNFPTTSGAYGRTLNGPKLDRDAFVSRLDPRKSGRAQLVYSTFLGGGFWDFAYAVSVDASGVVTVVGSTGPSATSPFPTTRGAYDTTHNGDYDVFVSRLDPSKSGRAQLVYSTFLGGSGWDTGIALSVDESGVVTLAGATQSPKFPVTSGAYDTTFNGPSWNGGDAFVSRLDPSKSGAAQLVNSTFLGGSSDDAVLSLAVDASGVVTVAGMTRSTNYPTTSGAFDTTYNGPTVGVYQGDAFVSRLDMGVALYGDVHAIPIKAGGAQKLTVNAGKAHKNRRYWIFGSVTGTSPGVKLLGVNIPLIPDVYTSFAIASVNSATFKNFRGTLDANGLAAAVFTVPANLPLPSGFTFYHAYVVTDASGRIYMASNPVPLVLRN